MTLSLLGPDAEIAKIDRHLNRLAGELKKVRGQYAEELNVLEQIDVLLDRRLRLGSEAA